MKGLRLETSTYDPCLLISTKESKEFGIFGMQTDDTLILGDETFLASEQKEIAKAGFLTKPVQVLNLSEPLPFSGCTITMDGEALYKFRKARERVLSW